MKAESEERHVRVSRIGFDDVNEALGWVITQLDNEFVDSSHVSIQIEKASRMDASNPDAVWEPFWQASIGGSAGCAHERVGQP